MNPYEPTDPRHAIMAHYIKDAHRIWKDDLTNAACAIGHSQAHVSKMTDQEAATLAAALVKP